MEKIQGNKKQIIFIGLLVLAFFLLMDLNSRLGDLFRLTSQRDTMATEQAGMEETQSAYVTKIAYATSQAAVEIWAGLQKQGQSGNIPIIPLVDSAATPQPQTLPTPTARVVQHWERWWALFFGK